MGENNDSYAERHRQADQTRGKIFTSATRLFHEKGFGKVTIRDLCKDADIAVGTFYLHYKSKQEILYEIYHQADEIMEIQRISDRTDWGTVEKVLELIRIQLSMASRFHLESDSIKQLYMYQLESDNQYFLSEDRQFHKQLMMVIEMGQASGELRIDLSSHDIGWKILRFSRGIVFDWALHSCSYDLIPFGIEEVRFFLGLFLL